MLLVSLALALLLLDLEEEVLLVEGELYLLLLVVLLVVVLALVEEVLVEEVVGTCLLVLDPAGPCLANAELRPAVVSAVE